MNTKFSDFGRSYNFGKVFGEKALEIIANLSKKEGDGKMAPEMRPMKPWPKEERNKILALRSYPERYDNVSWGVTFVPGALR